MPNRVVVSKLGGPEVLKYEKYDLPKNVEENEGIKDYTQFEGINDDWEEFNDRDLKP